MSDADNITNLEKYNIVRTYSWIYWQNSKFVEKRQKNIAKSSKNPVLFVLRLTFAYYNVKINKKSGDHYEGKTKS